MLWVAAAIVLVVVVLSLVIKGSTGLQWILSGLMVGSIYALVAMGFSIIYASTKVINFAQGEFSMLGGLIFLSLTMKKLPSGDFVRAYLPLWLAFICAVIVVMAIGAGFERLAIRPLKNPSVITVIIITIGLSILLRALAKWIWGSESLRVPDFTAGKPVVVFGASLVRQSFWVFGFTALVVVLVFWFFNRTLLGKGMRAASENPDAASLMGISPSTTSLVAWTMASALGAAAGIVFAPISFVAYDLGVGIGLKGFASAILGGLGSAQGAVVGGLVLGVLETITAGVFPSGYKDALAFLIIILVLLVRPQGLLGKREAVKV